MTTTLSEGVAESLLDDIIQRRYEPGALLPAEGELANAHGVSRITIREAVRILRTQNVVSIRRGRGTEVNPTEKWTSLKAVILASAGDDRLALPQKLLEARRMIEVGAAQLAATRCTTEDLENLDLEISTMQSAEQINDVSALVQADVAFHDIIMRATGNAFVPLLFDPFGPLLVEARHQTSAFPAIQRHAIEMHSAIVAALRSGDAERARQAMESHMDQTERDLHDYVIAPQATTVSELSVLGGLPKDVEVSTEMVRSALEGAPKLVVLDDDPTGTQTISGLPVITTWDSDDLRWALKQPTPGFFVLTNTRSLSAADAAARIESIATAVLAAARMESIKVSFASRGDSTLRGHFPLETDALSSVSEADSGHPTDAVLLIPAYIDAGRFTVDSVHWVRTPSGLVEVGTTEFAHDATFGFTRSRLPEWVEEKSLGRVSSDDVEVITIRDIRVGGPEMLTARLRALRGGVVVAIDAVTDDDLRVVAIASAAAEVNGGNLIYRVGPSFVRARMGQDASLPVSAIGAATLDNSARPLTGGLLVVGSHVAKTTRQLDRLVARCAPTVVELDVSRLLDHSEHDTYLSLKVNELIDALARGVTVLQTSRHLASGSSREDSLAIAREISADVAKIVRKTVTRVRPRFIVAKGGITSSDVATAGLAITRAWVRGTLLPGIVSLWDPASGIAQGIPYAVFAGNVGDDEALADVVENLLS